jgi:hypothetical protein
LVEIDHWLSASAMAPGRPVKLIKVHVPRHNAQRIGSKLGTAIKNKARTKKIRIELHQPSHDIMQAVVRLCCNADYLCYVFFETQESASEWNSLLITARAERGPQWDVGTQQCDDSSVSYTLVITRIIPGF